MSKANPKWAALAKGTKEIDKARAEAKTATAKATDTADKFHPAVNWLPELPEAEYEELKADIKTRGLSDPILRKEGLVISGKHRLRACRELGITPKFKEYDGDDILGEIYSREVIRRHLTPDQRVALVTKFKGKELGEAAKARMKAHQFGAEPTAALKSAQPNRTAEKIARIAKVGRDKARTALDVVKHDPKSLDAVIAGDKKLKDVKPKQRKSKPKADITYEPTNAELDTQAEIENATDQLAAVLTADAVRLVSKLEAVSKKRLRERAKLIPTLFCQVLKRQ